MNYEELITFLQNNHFYPSPEITRGVKGESITGIKIEAVGITADTKLERLTQVLEGKPVKITPFRKQGYIFVEFKKKKLT